MQLNVFQSELPATRSRIPSKLLNSLSPLPDNASITTLTSDFPYQTLSWIFAFPYKIFNQLAILYKNSHGTLYTNTILQYTLLYICFSLALCYEIHLYFHMQLHLTHSHCYIVFQCINIPQFICPFHCCWHLGCLHPGYC